MEVVPEDAQHQRTNPGGTALPPTGALSSDGTAGVVGSGTPTAQETRPTGGKPTWVTTLHPRSAPKPNGGGANKDRQELEETPGDPKAPTPSPLLTPSKRPGKSPDQLAARLQTRWKERNQERLTKASTSNAAIIGESTGLELPALQTVEPRIESGRTYLDSRAETLFRNRWRDRSSLTPRETASDNPRWYR